MWQPDGFRAFLKGNAKSNCVGVQHAQNTREIWGGSPPRVIDLSSSSASSRSGVCLGCYTNTEPGQHRLLAVMDIQKVGDVGYRFGLVNEITTAQ